MDARMINKTRGIIVEQNNENVTILTPDGQFIRGVADGQEVGSEVLVTPLLSQKRSYQSLGRKAIPAITVLAAALLLVLTLLFLPLREPALAFIQLEVNPAVEFGIDQEGKVREMAALNDDGAALIRELESWSGKEVTKLISLIFAEYGETDGELAVTAVRTGDEKLAAALDRTVRFIEGAAGEEGMLLRLSEAEPKMHERSREEGIPISRLIQQDRKSGEPASHSPQQEKRTDTETDKPGTMSSDKPSVPERKEGTPDPASTPKSDAKPKPASGNSGQPAEVEKKEPRPVKNREQEKPPKTKNPPIQQKPEVQKKPSGKPSENDTQNKKPQAPGKPENNRPHPQQGNPDKNNNGNPKGAERGGNGNPPAHAGPNKASDPPGHAGQDKQSSPPPHSGPKPGNGENQSGKEKPVPGQSESPGKGQPDKGGHQNNNSGNGKGGNGKGPGD
jgi:hypothetical protein